MQAGLVSKRLSFREIFMAMLRVFAVILIDIERPLNNHESIRLAGEQQLMTEGPRFSDLCFQSKKWGNPLAKKWVFP